MCFVCFIKVYLISIYLYRYFLFRMYSIYRAHIFLCISNRISHLFLLLLCIFRVDSVLIAFFAVLFGVWRCDTPGFDVFGAILDYFLLVLIIVPGLVLVFWCFFVVFDTPVFWLVFNGFGVFVFGGFAF